MVTWSAEEFKRQIDLYRRVEKLATVEKIFRVSDFNDVEPFPDVDAENAKVEELVDTELVLIQWEHRTLKRDDEEIPGIGMLLSIADDDSGKRYKVLSFSSVLRDQIGRVPKDQFPVLCRITQKGSGQRKFYTME